MQEISPSCRKQASSRERARPVAPRIQPVPTNEQPTAGVNKLKILLVSPYVEDRDFLRPIFKSARWAMQEVDTCGEAFKFLTYDRPAVIICEWDLPDGSWRDILSVIAPMPDTPMLLVASRVEDVRWAEVLNLGAYDMLAKPFDREEVTRVTSLAYLQWDRECPQSGTEPAPQVPGQRGRGRRIESVPSAGMTYGAAPSPAHPPRGTPDGSWRACRFS